MSVRKVEKAPKRPDTGKKPVKRRENSAETVYRELRRDIISMSLIPGSFLNEISLSKRFGLSRSPIREALIRLAGEGLIITEQNRCSLVAPFDIYHLPKLIDALCLMQRMTSRLAAQFRTQADLNLLYRLNDEYFNALAVKDVIAMVDLNRDLHAAVGQAGKNPYFASLYSRLLDESCRIIHFHAHIYDNSIPFQSTQGHVDLIEAITQKDADRADEIGKQHTQELWNAVVRFFSTMSLFDVDLSLLSTSMAVRPFFVCASSQEESA